MRQEYLEGRRQFEEKVENGSFRLSSYITLYIFPKFFCSHMHVVSKPIALLELNNAAASTCSGAHLVTCLLLGISSHLFMKNWVVIKALLSEDGRGRDIFHLFIDWILLEVRQLK